MYGSLDISVSGMIAQRVRRESIAANVANQGTYSDAAGRNNPYKRRSVVFAPGDPAAATPEGRRLGVHVSAINEEAGFDLRYDPSDPLADGQGYVKYPDINPVFETMNMMEAARAYEANVSAAEAAKSMIGNALRLIA
jgi:flagellar basal-body rod protein FlgC